MKENKPVTAEEIPTLDILKGLNLFFYNYGKRDVTRKVATLMDEHARPFKEQVQQLTAENERLREVQRWISVEEELPVSIDGYRVLALRIDGNMYVTSTWVLHMQIKGSGEYYTHWMPLPNKPELT